MQAEFWLKRWQEENISFHLAGVHPLLKKFHQQIFSGCSTTNSQVFVPLCGKTNDLRFLSQLNHPVLGCEISLKAVKDFFSEQEIEYTTQPELDFQAFCSNNLKILQGDYFKLVPDQLDQCSAIYDRAALIAMPEGLKQAYVEKIKSLFEKANMLLITLEYPEHEFQGPPFSVVEQGVESLFDFAKVKKLYTQDILPKEPRFAAKGITSLYESAYHIYW